MKPVLAYTLLLITSLGLAYQTWTRGDSVRPSGSVTLWSVDVDEISAIVYEAGRRRVSLERREDADPYLWGSVTRPVVGDSVSAARDTTTEFLVGQGADGLLALLASPRALRDLGMLDAEREEEYGLVGSLESLVVQVDREIHELLLGATVFRTNDRLRQGCGERARVRVAGCGARLAGKRRAGLCGNPSPCLCPRGCRCGNGADRAGRAYHAQISNRILRVPVVDACRCTGPA